MPDLEAPKEPVGEPLYTFVASKGRVWIGVVVCITFWLIGIALTNRLLGDQNNRGARVLGIMLTVAAGIYLRLLTYWMGLRILLHPEAIGLFRRGKMRFISWENVLRFDVDSTGSALLTIRNEPFAFFNITVVEDGDELARILQREVENRGIPWFGRRQFAPFVVRPHLGPVGRIVVGSAWIWLFSALPNLSDAAWDVTSPSTLWLGCGAAIIISLWLYFSLTSPMRFLRLPAVKWWLSVPMAGAIALTLALTDWGLMARLSLCENELMEYVNAVKPGQWDLDERSVGLFDVRGTREHDGGVYMHTAHSLLSKNGIAHIPPGREIAPQVRIRHLYGSWYWYEEK